eukprot:SAG22_NODE_9908_length_564_cov_0.688172_1_plen_49_part_10
MIVVPCCRHCLLLVCRYEGTHWKYVHFTAQSLPPLLFEMDNDQAEAHDL